MQAEKYSSDLERLGSITSKANTDALLLALREEPLRMACQRFQTGQLKLRGKKGRQKWIGRWREDVIRPDGSIHRIRKNEVLGTLKEYRTRRLALRELQRRLAEVNSITSKARPVATFREFATKWQRDVMSLHKRSTQSGDRSRMRRHLVPALGDFCMKDISREILQRLVTEKSETLSAKSVRNLVVLLGEMWKQARADNYTQVDPFEALVLPVNDLPDEEPCLTVVDHLKT